MALKTAEDVQKMREDLSKTVNWCPFYLSDLNALKSYGDENGLFELISACFDLGFTRGITYQKNKSRGRAKKPVSSSCGIREEA